MFVLKAGRDRMLSSYYFYGFSSHPELCRKFQSVEREHVVTTVFTDFLVLVQSNMLTFLAIS